MATSVSDQVRDILAAQASPNPQASDTLRAATSADFGPRPTSGLDAAMQVGQLALGATPAGWALTGAEALGRLPGLVSSLLPPADQPQWQKGDVGPSSPSPAILTGPLASLVSEANANLAKHLQNRPETFWLGPGRIQTPEGFAEGGTDVVGTEGASKLAPGRYPTPPGTLKVTVDPDEIQRQAAQTGESARGRMLDTIAHEFVHALDRAKVGDLTKMGELSDSWASLTPSQQSYFLGWANSTAAGRMETTVSAWLRSGRTLSSLATALQQGVTPEFRNAYAQMGDPLHLQVEQMGRNIARKARDAVGPAPAGAPTILKSATQSVPSGPNNLPPLGSSPGSLTSKIAKALLNFKK